VSRRLGYLFSRAFYELAPMPIYSAVSRMTGASSRLFCPVCEQKVRAFAALPEFYSQQLKEHGCDLRLEDFETCNFAAYQCPHCGATDRDRLYALYLAKRLPQSSAEQEKFSMLDIAPSAPLSRHIRRKYRIRYRTADLYMKNVDDRVDVTALTCYPDGTFDALICSHVLEHVEDDRKAMAELCRVLKPGGWGIVMVPISLILKEIREEPTKTSREERLKFFGQEDHARVYCRQGFARRLEEAGFSVKQHGGEYLGGPDMDRCALAASSVLYVVEKLD
jgi:SAM-dependent methyltransferase